VTAISGGERVEQGFVAGDCRDDVRVAVPASPPRRATATGRAALRAQCPALTIVESTTSRRDARLIARSRSPFAADGERATPCRAAWAPAHGGHARGGGLIDRVVTGGASIDEQLAGRSAAVRASICSGMGGLAWSVTRGGGLIDGVATEGATIDEQLGGAERPCGPRSVRAWGAWPGRSLVAAA